MDPENDRAKQQLEALKKRHLLEQRRIQYLEQYMHDLKKAQKTTEQATKDKQEKQQQQKQQIGLSQRMLKEGRAA